MRVTKVAAVRWSRMKIAADWGMMPARVPVKRRWTLLGLRLATRGLRSSLDLTACRVRLGIPLAINAASSGAQSLGNANGEAWFPLSARSSASARSRTRATEIYFDSPNRLNRLTAIKPTSTPARSTTSAMIGHGVGDWLSVAAGVGLVSSISDLGIGGTSFDAGVGVGVGVTVSRLDVGVATVGVGVGVTASGVGSGVATCGVGVGVSFASVTTGVGDVTSGVGDWSPPAFAAFMISCNTSGTGALVPGIGERPSPNSIVSCCALWSHVVRPQGEVPYRSHS